MTIIIIAHNEMEYVKKSIRALQVFASDSFQLVLVDNASTDGLNEWAKQQNDLVYVKAGDVIKPYGEVLNHIVREYVVGDCFLVVEPHMITVDDAIQHMYSIMTRDESIGAVGPLSNVFSRRIQSPDVEIRTYQEAIGYKTKLLDKSEEYSFAIGLEKSAVMYSKKAWEEVGGFHGRLGNLRCVTQDCMIRMLCKGYKILIDHKALFFGLRNEISEPEDVMYLMDADFSEMEKIWGMHYFGTMGNTYIIDMIRKPPETPLHILEVGCDIGATLMQARNKYRNARIFGCELNENAVKIAKNYLDECITLNIEDETLAFSENSMDYIIFGDVLEHLHDPAKTLKYIKKFLKNDGCVIASIPNVMHISVMEQLLRGDFTYTDTGLLDRTHIHLFTYKEIKKIFCETGYRLLDYNATVVSINEKQKQLIDQLLILDDRAERFMYEAFQYIVLYQRE